MFTAFLSLALAGLAAVGLAAVTERSLKRLQLNALHHYRRRRAHVRWMRRHRRRMAEMEQRWKTLYPLLAPNLN